MRLPAAEGQNHSHGKGNANKGRPAIGNQRQRHALRRQQRNIHPHVDHRLQAENNSQATQGKRRKGIRLNLRPLQDAHDDKGKEQHQADAGNQAEFLADDREGEIRMRVGKNLLGLSAAGTRTQ